MQHPLRKTHAHAGSGVTDLMPSLRRLDAALQELIADIELQEEMAVWDKASGIDIQQWEDERLHDGERTDMGS